MNDESNYADYSGSSEHNSGSTDSYAELIAIVDAAIVDYNLTVTDIANALRVYSEWCDMTGETELDGMLFDRNLYPLTPSDIRYYQRIEQLYMNGNDDNDDNYDD